MNPLDHVPGWALRPLPEAAVRVLEQFAPPPRLLAHLRLVHDVAVQLCDRLQADGLLPAIDRESVFFGAATHDIGKIEVPHELIGGGSEHERLGEPLLLAHGVSAEWARFARTHAQAHDPANHLEDVLVALSDTCWKGTRDALLEERLVQMLTDTTHRDRWEVWIAADSIIEQIAADADRRLMWQGLFPAS